MIILVLHFASRNLPSLKECASYLWAIPSWHSKICSETISQAHLSLVSLVNAHSPGTGQAVPAKNANVFNKRVVSHGSDCPGQLYSLRIFHNSQLVIIIMYLVRTSMSSPRGCLPYSQNCHSRTTGTIPTQMQSMVLFQICEAALLVLWLLFYSSRASLQLLTLIPKFPVSLMK